VHGHVVEDGATGGVLHGLSLVVECKKKGTESLWPDGSKAEGALGSQQWVALFGNALNEEELAMCTEVLDAEQGTLPHLRRTISEALVEEGQEILGLQVGIEMRLHRHSWSSPPRTLGSSTSLGLRIMPEASALVGAHTHIQVLEVLHISRTLKLALVAGLLLL